MYILYNFTTISGLGAVKYVFESEVWVHFEMFLFFLMKQMVRNNTKLVKWDKWHNQNHLIMSKAKHAAS